MDGHVRRPRLLRAEVMRVSRKEFANGSPRGLFLALAALASLAVTGGGCGPRDSSSASTDPIPECASPASTCATGRVCHVDDDDLCGGYCAPPCGQCPAGTACADSFCAVTCAIDSDCPRDYQFCKKGFCLSDKNACP